MDTSTNAKGVRVNRCGRVSVVCTYTCLVVSTYAHSDLSLINNLNLIIM